jgi:peptidoglycan/xylan/chitin deacetylase (PgdA/CDA1 family)
MPGKGVRRLRGNLKTAIAAAITKAHDHGLAGPLARRTYRPLVLGYHRVVEDFQAESRVEMPSMLTSRAMFERHLDCLATSFRFVTLDEIGTHLESGIPFEKPVVAITFDDGYQDVYDNALPVLERKGIPAAMFVVTDLVGRPFWQIHDKLYHLIAKAFASWSDPRREMFGLLSALGLPAHDLTRRSALASPMLAVSTLLPSLPQADIRRVMAGLESSVGNGFHRVPLAITWDMAADMRRRGFIIGSHTRTHVSLPMESPATVAEEVEGSKRELERRLGETIQHFAYPGGQFTSDIVGAVARAEYQYAYTACPHDVACHPTLTIERLLLWEGSSVTADGDFTPDILSCLAHDLWPPARRCERVHQL